MENILSLIPPKGTAVSKRYAVAYKMSFLLSSRLYCWLRILTVSAGHDAFRPTFEYSVLPLFVLRRVVDSSLRRVHNGEDRGSKGPAPSPLTSLYIKANMNVIIRQLLLKMV